jgi:DnaJ-class molecular chaperone
VRRAHILPLALSAALLLVLAACSKTCRQCSGTGEIRVSGPCAVCGGTGKVTVTCQACSGEGRLGAGSPCPRCQGQKILTCDYRGFVDVMVSEGDSSKGECAAYEKVAVLCRQGRLYPAQPGQEGQEDAIFRDTPSRVCPACRGEGRTACTYCGGTGKSHGSGVCTACGGSGHVEKTCSNCDGTGVADRSERCPTCGGSGRVIG